MRDFRLPPRRERDIRSSGMLRGVDWYLATDVLGSTFKKNARPLKMGRVPNYQPTLRNVAEE
jgi:hypothetical protein